MWEKPTSWHLWCLKILGLFHVIYLSFLSVQQQYTTWMFMHLIPLTHPPPPPPPPGQNDRLFADDMFRCIFVNEKFSILIKMSLINLLRANFFRGNINIYLPFMSFLHIDVTQVLKILLQVRQGPTYSIQSISWLLMYWRRKEPGHQQQWYWPSSTEITRSPHVKG